MREKYAIQCSDTKSWFKYVELYIIPQGTLFFFHAKTLEKQQSY